MDDPRTRRAPGSRILACAALLEAGTGLALMTVPAIVVELLFGATLSGAGMPVARIAGMALLALGVACWPSRQHTDSNPPAFRSMLVYNALIALYLAYLGTVGHLVGPLLWPGVVLHAAVTLLLVWTWRNGRGTPRATTAR